MFLKKLFSVSAISLAFVSCGSDDEGGGGAPSIDDVISDLENPTGSIETAEGAQGVAGAFATEQSNRAFGERRDGISCDDVNQMTGEVTCECTGGGSLTVTGSGDASGSGSAHWDANNCCQGAAEGCCYDGTLDLLINSAQGATYSICYVYDITLSQCREATVYISYCQDDMGRQWWVIRYMDETYSVTGSYTEGVGGTWSVRDANTTWNCVEDSTGAGCCSSADSESIIWDGGDALCPAVQ